MMTHLLLLLLGSRAAATTAANHSATQMDAGVYEPNNSLQRMSWTKGSCYWAWQASGTGLELSLFAGKDLPMPVSLNVSFWNEHVTLTGGRLTSSETDGRLSLIHI